jgi:hypothetical protein
MMMFQADSRRPFALTILRPGRLLAPDLTVSSKEERKGNAVRDEVPIPQLPPQL